MEMVKTVSKEIQEKIARTCVKFLVPLFAPLILLGLLAASFPHFQPTRFWIALVTFLTIVLFPMILIRKDESLSALKMVILGLHILIFNGTILNNGVDAPVYVAFMLTLVLISWISTSLQTTIYTVSFLVYGLLLVVLDSNGILPERDRPTDLARYVYYLAYFVSVSMATILGNRLLHRTLQESERKQKLLVTTFAAIPDALMVLARDGSVLDMNQEAELLLENLKEKDNTTDLREIILESKENRKRTLITYLKEKQFQLENLRLRLAESSVKAWYSISSSLLIHEDGSSGAVVVIRDITTEVEQEYNLIQAQKMDAVGQLASGIAHDFNNMLGGIQGASDLLQSDARDDQKDMLNLISSATDKASKLTKELLVFSRKAPHASTAVDVHSIIQETAFLLGRTLDKRIAVSTNLDAEGSLVVGDDTLIQSALMNMGINASHAMPDGGSLTFSTSVKELDELYCTHSEFDITPGEFLAIEITDTGSGMTSAVQNRIFEPFFTTKEVGKGTGLGMAAVYSMVVKHSGAITIYSEPGEGTSFHILLPLARKSAELLRVVDEQVVKGSGTVLIVDDEQFIRITTTELLRTLGYTVYSVENGEQALEFLSKQSVDVILLDMIMPVMNGRETFEKIVEQGIETKVILSSGFSKEEDVSAMKKLGLFGFLHKPYQRSELSQMVANAVKG